MQGGVGDFTKELGRALAEMGIEVSVITSVKARMQDTRPTMQDAGNVHRASCIVHPVIEQWDWGSWRRIIGLLGKTCPDIVNIQYQAAAYGMHPAINFLPLRLQMSRHPCIRSAHPLTTFHDLRVPYLFPKAGRVRWWAILALARWSDAAIVTNAEDRATLSSYPFIRSLSLVPIGSNISANPPAGFHQGEWRRRWNVGDDETLLSYFGFLSESKGGNTLIRALHRLVQDGHKVKLLMVGGQVGSSDPTNLIYLQKVRRLIEELNLQDRVLWTGYTPQEGVSANLLASDICVLPYRDGASFRRGSFMAALAHGLPIVSTQPKVELPELSNGKNIALVPPDDPDALADRIRDLAASPEARRQLGEGAKALAETFSWGSIAERTLQVYEEVLSL